MLKDSLRLSGPLAGSCLVAIAAWNEFQAMNHFDAWQRVQASTGFPLWLLFAEFQILTCLTILLANSLFSGKKFESAALMPVVCTCVLSGLDQGKGVGLSLMFITLIAASYGGVAIFHRRNPKLFERPSPKLRNS